MFFDIRLKYVLAYDPTVFIMNLATLTVSSTAKEEREKYWSQLILIPLEYSQAVNTR